jgi:hypothetical protein
MAKLVCPLCGTFTAPIPSWFKATVSRTVYAFPGPAVSSEDGWAQAVTVSEAGQPTYSVIVCQACGKRFLAELKGNEWSAVYPIAYKAVAKEIPEPMRSEFEEACLCFAVGAHKGCLLMCRTTLIALQREQKVSSLGDLKDKGTISDRLFRQADQVRLWANMVGHEDIPKDSEQLLAYVEVLLDDVYVKPARLAALSQKREQLKKGTKPSPT